MDSRNDGWKDGKTLFYRTLPAKDGGPKKNPYPKTLKAHRQISKKMMFPKLMSM